MNRIISILVLILLLQSCKTQRADKQSDLNYLQNVKQIATQAAVNNATATIQTGDQLVIFVSAKNMEVVRPFNQGYYTAQTPAPAAAPNVERTYLVDSEGTIDFPILGTLTTRGKTLEEFKAEMHDRISTYVKSPVVTVRLANFKVTVLGEVARPNQYAIPEGQTTVLNALGLAGDITMYGKRDDVLVVRNVNGIITEERLNLLDANFINSPYFQLKQGDVIYVSANSTKEKTARLNPNTGTYIAVAGTIIGLAGIFITIFKN